ncbi:hypothetical protein AMS68_004110 [Peltaster fructicola]|uniref:CDP-diacylglycerol--glycerol-3-phosphate 3-phosphatidyltransferase n=1 Tax=Peltaster fructicola TaxID=286661 RepID=A0A6H0XV27_9PEZI|nr:hypothetical protein AMS68_004110 [Peltaster fructicola]
MRTSRTTIANSRSYLTQQTLLSLCGRSRLSRASINGPRALHLTRTVLQTPQTPPQKPEKGYVERHTEQSPLGPSKGITDRINIYNLPNLLTVSRLFAAPLTAYLLVHDQHTWALAVFAYAGFTDLVDGWMARKWKLQTVAGSVIDPMADKALMIIVTVTLAAKAAIPAYLATLILGRDASLALAAIWYRYASLPAPKTFARYWDFSLPSAEVHPTTVSKYNTFLQLILIGSTLALPVITADNHHLGMLHDLGLGKLDLHQAMLGLQILVAGTTVWSGLSYAFLKNAVTIIGSNEALKARQGVDELQKEKKSDATQVT